MVRKRSSTFKAHAVGGENSQEVYRRLSLSTGSLVELSPKKAAGKIFVMYKKKGFFSSSYENLGYLSKSKDLLDQIEAGHQILNPTVADYYDDGEGAKRLILEITVEYEFDPNSDYWKKRRW